MAVFVLDQSDARRPVRVIFDGDDIGPYVVFVAFEIDQAIHAFVPAATKTGAREAVMIAPAFFWLGQQQGFLRLFVAVGDLDKITHRALPPARCCRVVVTNSHSIFPKPTDCSPWEYSLEELNPVIRMQGNNGFFP